MAKKIINKSPNKKTAAKKSEQVTVPIKNMKKSEKSDASFNAWSLSIYVYWFIILFFISATFYILGRSHGILNPVQTNVEITEEALLQSNDYINSGKTQLLSGNVSAAIIDLTAAIEMKTNSADAFILRGEAYLQTGNYANALADFNSAIAMDSENSVAYYDRALLYTRTEDYANALSDINNSLAARASNPNDILQLRDIYALRGKLNLWLKNWEGAKADYTNSLAQTTGVVNPNVYAERAAANTALGDYDSAINDYMSAVRVISEQIQGTSNMDVRTEISRNALGYFEKSAALNLKVGNISAARADLESARTIAIALDDSETGARLMELISEL